MPETEKNARRLSDAVVLVGECYCVQMGGHATATVRDPDGLIVSVHMTEDQARDLCGGLKDALR